MKLERPVLPAIVPCNGPSGEGSLGDPFLVKLLPQAGSARLMDTILIMLLALAGPTGAFAATQRSDLKKGNHHPKHLLQVLIE